MCSKWGGIDLNLHTDGISKSWDLGMYLVRACGHAHGFVGTNPTKGQLMYMGKFLRLVRMVAHGSPFTNSFVAPKTIYCGLKFSTVHFHYLSLTILQQTH